MRLEVHGTRGEAPNTKLKDPNKHQTAKIDLQLLMHDRRAAKQQESPAKHSRSWSGEPEVRGVLNAVVIAADFVAGFLFREKDFSATNAPKRLRLSRNNAVGTTDGPSAANAATKIPSPPSDGGEGRGEEVRFETEELFGMPLSSVLSPLLRRGERKNKTALRKIVAARDDSFQ